jgi:uncharacterized protein YeaO (DUF488 family)
VLPLFAISPRPKASLTWNNKSLVLVIRAGDNLKELIMTVRIKRIYEPAAKSDGYRILVDRLWPRGIKKADAHFDKWLKEVAPTNELRKWFSHDPEKWKQFITKYHSELKGSDAFKELRSLVKEHKTVTLLYGAKDEEHNQAEALRQFLEG